ncbi:acyltransferase family protein [Halomonas cerina]|uniref:Peptidoglycan/LPS O-acetylase OafA/YrhL n=1 Tax=Halomonas cerina TaxID=447424 RepID=A0A839V5W5_9GAMM|nr:acyltransferase family protein [Halomonas cerina]MBB3189388.1 peptidoglycan/LPS O-acetylase OafA/YrhL [Halomonas cerina]
MSTYYRPEVDGLRAVAVIPVILFHAGLDAWSGGFVGVDIFFVVSGYLITGIIYNEIRQGNFSIIKFYERRARRILPALFFVSLTCLAIAWIWMLPKEFSKLSESLVAVNLFVSNIYFWQDVDYFAGPADMQPFLHTWSLAVEEQFYLFFPLVMLVLGMLRRHYLLVMVFLAFLLSLILAEYGARNHPAANFYLLPTRAWELMAGALIAIGLHERELKLPRAIHDGGAFLGLGMILYSIFLFDESTPFPSLWALIPVLGAALVILFARHDNAAGKLLAAKPVVGIGLISYSAYLWHQPVFVFARERSFGALSQSDFLLLSLLSLILAYFSWRFVEQPFRDKRNFSRATIFSGALAGTVCFIGIGLYGTYTQGIPWRLNAAVAQVADVRNDRHLQSEGCQSMPGRVIPIEEACEYNGEYMDKVVVWGDSQATPLVGPVAERAKDLGLGVKQFVYTNCLPVAGYTRSDEPECGSFNEDAMNYMVDNDHVKLVVMLGRYPLQFEGETFDNREGGIEEDNTVYAVPFDKAKTVDPAMMTNRVPLVGERIQQTVNTLVSDGKKVVLIYPVPEVGWDVPFTLAKEMMYGKARAAPLSTSHEVFKERVASAYEQLDLVENHKNLLKIKPESLFCDTYLTGRCTTQVNDELLYYDNNHLSKAGATLVVDHIFDEMKEVGWLKDKRVELGWLND